MAPLAQWQEQVYWRFGGAMISVVENNAKLLSALIEYAIASGHVVIVAKCLRKTKPI